MKLLLYPDKFLETVCDEVANPKEDLQIAEEMLKIMLENRGIGLAAPQVGLLKRIVIVGTKCHKDWATIMFNPEISNTGKSKEIEAERCLSFPGMEKELERWLIVDVKYQDIKGEWKTETFKRLKARVLQHEIDHLNGISCMLKGDSNDN